MSFTLENDAPQKLFKKVKKSIREKFLQIFGTSLAMSSDMSIHYKYSIEYILKIRPFFSNGIQGLVFNYKNQTSNIQTAQNIMDNVLHGTYVYENGEERLYFTNNQGQNRYVRMNYTSSGQQESVWIFNILLYSQKLIYIRMRRNPFQKCLH